MRVIEYNISVGDIYKTYVGTPDEIAKLVKLLEKEPDQTIIVNTSVHQEIDIEKIKEEVEKQISSAKCKANIM